MRRRWPARLQSGCLALLLVIAHPAAAAAPFRSMGDNSGIDAEVVAALLVDREGLLWVGTREGLIRYDGYSALRYLPGERTLPGLTDADIRKLYQAPDGTLWIATNTGGLNRLRPEAEAFASYRHDPANVDSLTDDSVYDMVAADEGKLWVATQRGLNLLDPETGSVQRFQASNRGGGQEPVQGVLSNDYIYQLLKTPGGELWVATVGGGLNLLPRGDTHFLHHPLAQLTGVAEHDDVFAMVAEEDGSLWLGTRGGLLRYWPGSRELTRIDLSDDEQQPVVTSMIRGPGNSLLLGTVGRGVLRYEPGERLWRHLQPAPLGSPGQLPPLPQLSLALSGKLLFVGTWGGGLFSTRLDEPEFRLLGVESGQPQLRNSNVSALYHDGQRLLVGSFGGGLQALVSPDRGLSEDFPAPLDLDGESLLSLLPLTDGKLYAASTRGLWQLDPDSGTAVLQQYDAGRADSLGEGYVTALAEEPGGGLWVGTGGSGLYFAGDPDDDSYQVFRADPAAAAAIAGDYVSALLRLPGELWVGSRSQGLSRCQLPDMACRPLPGEPVGAAAVSGLVSHLLRGRDGSVWIATGSEGLLRLRPDDSGKLTAMAHFGVAQGLLSDGIMSIAEDDNGSLWLASREGLSRLQPDDGAVVNYPPSAGIPVAHFNTGVATAGPDYLYFGSPRGLLAVPRGTAFTPRVQHETRITSLQTSAADSGMAKPLHRPGRIALPYGQVVSLGFSVLDYSEQPHRYQYRMRDNQAWVALGERNQISFYNLAPGRYSFAVRGRDVFGAWSVPDRVAIRIIPPFWQTLWFRGLVLVAALTLFLLLHRLRMRRLRQHNRQLTLLERQRHRALLREQRSRNHLEQAYLGLQNLTHRLETAKEEERQEISRELHDELGQSLTATKINLQLLQQANSNPANSDTPEDSQRLSDSIAIIDNMIAQVRSVSLSLRPPLLDEAGLIAAVQDYLEQVRQRGELAVELSCDQSIDELVGERAILIFRIIQESVTNILRHADASQVNIQLRRTPGELLIRVRDNGRGFNVREVNRRIERGEHLGLLGIRERARNAGGRVKLSSRPGEGCSLEVRIPW